MGKEVVIYDFKNFGGQRRVFEEVCEGVSEKGRLVVQAWIGMVDGVGG